MSKKKRMDPLLRLIIKIVVIAVAFVLLFTFVLGIHIQKGNTMHPHLKDGDVIVFYRLEDYHAGDAVVYRDPESGKKAISRIAAIGENEINITQAGEFLINGVIPGTEVFYPTMEPEGGSVSYPYQMSEGGYFLLNDQRMTGHDSRIFGEVKKKDLLGKVVYVFRRRGF